MIEEVGVPSLALMESAGRGVADTIRAWCSARGMVAPRTLVWCGPGNNGGDGYVVARHLAAAGWEVRALPVLPPRSDGCRAYHSVATALGLVGDLSEPALIVDAVYGTGQRVPLSVPALSLGTAKCIALDVPTGVEADSGQRIADFPAPDLTVTIGRYKPGLFADATASVLVDIGLELVANDPPEAWLVTGRPWIPEVIPSANKWDRGHVGVVAGSETMAGAAVLTCIGALRGGAGLVTLFTPRSAWSRLEGLPAEVMVAEPGGEGKCDVLVVGPGLGTGAGDESARLWRDFPGPAVFDADGLRSLTGPSAYPRLITPHAGEAARLLGEEWRLLEVDRLATARRLTMFGAAIYKGTHPVIAGTELHIVRGGNSVLGMGGSGDVLAGVCGGLAANARRDAQFSFEAVALAATWLQQAAASVCAVGTLPSEVARAIPLVRANLY